MAPNGAEKEKTAPARSWKWLVVGILLGVALASLLDIANLTDQQSWAATSVIEAAKISADDSLSSSIHGHNPEEPLRTPAPIQRQEAPEAVVPSNRGAQPTQSQGADKNVPRQPALPRAHSKATPATPSPAGDSNEEQQVKTTEVKSPTSASSDIKAPNAKASKANSSASAKPSGKKAPNIPNGTSINDPAMRNYSYDPLEHRTGGPVWPTGAPSSYNWSLAVMQLYKVPKRKKGLSEVLFALDPARRHKCGKDCVAHCLAGQPRDFLVVPGLAKGMKHRLFDIMSPNRVIFAVLSVSAATSSAGTEGAVGYVRGNIGSAKPKDLIEPLKYIDIDRALLLDESCQSGACLKNIAGIVCDAKKLGLIALFDKKNGVVANLCDIQFRRYQTCLHLVREYEIDHNISIAWVTRQRPDVYWLGPANRIAGTSPRFVYLHAWGACGYGGADWFFYASRSRAEILARFPDEFSCSNYFQKGVLPHPCHGCLGCECSLVAWLTANKVPVKVMPGNDYMPAKFCGGACPHDFKTPRAGKKTNLTGYSAAVLSR